MTGLWSHSGLMSSLCLSLSLSGVHIVQMMIGCEWDDETDEVKGYEQHGYDGEDFLSFDLKTETWVAPKQQAVITKHKWDHNKALIAQYKHFLTQECPEELKKFVNYGRSSLLRTGSITLPEQSSYVSSVSNQQSANNLSSFFRAKPKHERHNLIYKECIFPKFCLPGWDSGLGRLGHLVLG